jgi:hypothetical protein
MQPKPSRTIFVILALLVLATMACSLIGRAAERVGERVAERAERAIEEQLTRVVPELIPDGEEPPSPEDEIPSGEIGSPDASTGLEMLDSYQAVFSIEVNGQDAEGQPAQGRFEILHELDRPAQIEHTRFSGTGAVTSTMTGFQNSQTDIYNLDGSTFMYSLDAEEKASCIGFSSGEEAPGPGDFLSLHDMVQGVGEARLVQRGDTYNGIQVDHYTFDENGIYLGSFTQASGDYWVAQDGGYLVKLHGEGDGSSDWFGSGVQGTYVWDYELTRINEPVEITLPSECEAQKPAEDIPVPDNALDEGSFSGMITFNSPDSPQVVAEFYRQRMEPLGWTVNSDETLGDMLMLEYGKEGRKLSIMITWDEADGSSVVITETEE